MLNQLFLQTDRVRRNDDAPLLAVRASFRLSGENRGDQIGETLADTGPGFGDQMMTFRQCRFDSQCHFKLFRTWFIILQPSSNHAAST